MTAFDQRKDKEEKKFAHDGEMGFKVAARRNRLLGEWVAEQLGLKPEEVETYAKSVVEADFDEPGEEDVVKKIKADFERLGVALDERDLRDKMHELREVAVQQLKSE